VKTPRNYQRKYPKDQKGKERGGGRFFGKKWGGVNSVKDQSPGCKREKGGGPTYRLFKGEKDAFSSSSGGKRKKKKKGRICGVGERKEKTQRGNPPGWNISTGHKSVKEKKLHLGGGGGPGKER